MENFSLLNLTTYTLGFAPSQFDERSRKPRTAETLTLSTLEPLKLEPLILSYETSGMTND